MLSVLIFAAAAALPAASPAAITEAPVAPYAHGNANADATAFAGDGMWKAFHGQAGVDRIVDDFVRRNSADPTIGDIFVGQDLVRLRRLLKEQFCYILNGGCTYSGRDMKAAHQDMGVQAKDMNVLVGNLQLAMAQERVANVAQNRLLAKLAPMRRDIVTR